jgi:hypothetical protein
MAVNTRLEAAHRHCTANEDELRQSKVAGCFYCTSVFPATAVSQFLKNERTALCPECMIDSVLGDASGVPITPDFLAEMHQYWFERPSHGAIKTEDPNPGHHNSPVREKG